MAEADLLRRAAGRVDGVPERFVPSLMAGEPLAAEHLARYDWAAALAADRRVLDAGCGVGYGSTLLARGGAQAVVGVDSSEDALAVARAELDEASLSFECADLRQLPHPDGSFGLVVCFEVVEHIADVEQVLSELTRVLADDGLLAVSTPNRDRNVPGNPHHVHELVPEELHELLARHLPEVRLARQVSFLASGILDEDELGEVGMLPSTASVRTTISRRPGEELYTIGLAGRHTLPSVAPAVALGDPFEVRRWTELYAEQKAEAARQRTEVTRIYAAYDEQRAAARELQASAQATSARLAAVLAEPRWRLIGPLRALRRGRAAPRP